MKADGGTRRAAETGPGRGPRRWQGVISPRRLWVALVTLIFTAAGDRHAIAIDSNKQCGVLAVFGALRAEGIAVDYEELIQPQYIGSAMGSSLGELVRAVRDQGGHALPLAGLSAEVLRGLDCPAVLHVSGRESPGVYQHWLLFLGDDQGQALVSDVGGQVERCSYAQLLARWDGAGLLISARPIERRTLARVAVPSAALPLLLSGAAVVAAWGVGRRWVPRLVSAPRATWPGVVAILVGGTLLGVAHHAWAISGLLRDGDARRTVFLGYRAQHLRKLELEELSALLTAGEHTMIDARLPDSYRQGYIPGAINVPINADKQRRAALLAEVPKSRPLIVYCQSSSCPFDETVAAALLADGFADVSIFPAGWAAWSEANRVK